MLNITGKVTRTRDDCYIQRVVTVIFLHLGCCQMLLLRPYTQIDLNQLDFLSYCPATIRILWRRYDTIRYEMLF